MNRFRLLLSLIQCMALSASLQAADPITELRKSGLHTITVDGLERSFLIDVPQVLKPGAALVMVFHGYTGSAEAIRKYAGFTSLVNKYGFVAVYPVGTIDQKRKRFFNVGYDFHRNMKVDDVKFARELAARLVTDLDLDPYSVFSTGMSNGADMSYFMVCQSEPFLNAIAPVAGFMLPMWTNGFTTATRVSVMEVHGTRDKVTLWAGDPQNRDGWGAYLGTEAIMDFWVKQLSLENSDVTELPNLHFRNKTLGLRLHHWWTAADNAEVRLYEIKGGGHDWPDNLGNKEISTAEEIWKFFQHHRPGRQKGL